MESGPKWLKRDNWLFQITEIVQIGKKAYHLRLAGCFGVHRVRKNGKDGVLFNRKPRYW